MPPTSPRTNPVASLARRQHGHVTRAQLLEIGLSSSQITRRLGAGSLIRRHSGVYAVGHVPHSPIARAAAAVLAGGAGASLSHGSAAVPWEMLRHWSFPLEITVPGDRRPRGIRVHRTRLAPRDITTHFGLRMTTPARTLLDLAPRLSDARLARGYNEMRLRHFIRPRDLIELLDRCPHAPAARRAGALLNARGGPTRSELEDAFLAFVREHGLPEPELNVVVAGQEVDAFFPGPGLIVELDSIEFHLTPEAFEADRDRDANALVAGHPTVRLTHERLRDRGPAEAERLHALIESASRGC
jgi:hypothetical protein